MVMDLLSEALLGVSILQQCLLSFGGNKVSGLLAANLSNVLLICAA
jgi:hypothetical protein